MFFVVISRVKDKVLLLMRLILIMCILLILAVQLYGILKSSGISGNLFDKTKAPPDAIRVDQSK
ncbi:hypothetical protein IT084_03620 [Desulfallas sp. Bu1-1]|jgi:hypothetical protein|uniref:hypothetical protein n=1 Tax=Desulfallas sp. Bu1-1 TaxID=2787620 RepID=UPI00189D0438|nr:hypothetical protein [Desulfallas sp. Bu1-1]MBF7082064.1 hypothetical protein [Desulfallas sp. Bu1-1]